MNRRVGILGAGRMATGLATLLTAAGEDVVMSSRKPEARIEEPARVVTFSEAADLSDVVVLAISHAGLPDLAESVRHFLEQKVVIDITNSVIFQEGRIKSGLREGISEGTWAASLLPDSRVTRAFNHIQDEMLVSRARRQPGIWGVAVAGDDEQAVDVTEDLVIKVGFVPVNVGSLAASDVIDPGGPVFPHMFAPVDLADIVRNARTPGLAQTRDANAPSATV